MTSRSDSSSYVYCLRDPNQIALTFDDGPNSDGSYTEQLLKILKDYGDTKATFFLIGEYVESQKEIVRKIYGSGHAIGNHSYSHPDLESYSCEKNIEIELEKCRDAINQALKDIGSCGPLFRAPYGRMGGNVLSVACAMGLKVISWSVDPKDYEPDPKDPQKPMSAAEIVRRVSASIDVKARGQIVLLHDGCTRIETTHEDTRGWRPDRSETIKATEMLLKMYLGKRQFVSLRPGVEMLEGTIPKYSGKLRQRVKALLARVLL
jgi:peptidoglycan/xylan/chitin deacetylase (PgdA/CDA1 family)